MEKKVIRKKGFSKYLRLFVKVREVLNCVRYFRNWIAVTRLYAGWSELPPGFMAISRSGWKITCVEPSDIQTLWVIWCGNDYYLPRSCHTVLDLGANIGVFTIKAANFANAETVISLEPVEGTFKRLEKTINENQLSSRVTSLQKGIGNSTGQRTIWLGSASPHSSMFFRGDKKWESGEESEIETITLSDLFAELDVSEIDFTKMDCEGGEVEAVLQADKETLRKMKFISMEYHFPENLSTWEELSSKLFDAGFTCVKHKPKEKIAWFKRT